MVVEQIKVVFDNFSYVIYCSNKKEAAIVDPSFDASKALDCISSNKLKIKYIILTHYHSDHTNDTKRIKNLNPSSKTVASESDGEKMDFNVDIIVSDGDKLNVGDINLDFILTPGHTQGGICIIVDNEAILTGDTLFIGDCGRTDLPGGSFEQMFKTLQEKIKPLPDNLIVFPGHDYGNKPFDTLGNQKRTNKTLIAKNLVEFSKIP
jgi:glyoxylase-like metal-dependent hydrolase (beta-lactamase superfamily II)